MARCQCRTIRFFLLLVLLSLRPARTWGQAPTIRDWKLVCFCNSRVRTPHFIVTMDNNGEILYAARAGITRSDLSRRGITASESQLRLMEDWDLLAGNGDSLRTTFPVLGPESAALLRTELHQLAVSTVPKLRPYIDTVAHLLGRRIDRPAMYGVIFSYVLDGLVWDSLAPGTDLVPNDITVEYPFWNGAFWAIASARSFAPGTNSARLDDSTSILLTWTQGTLATQQQLDTRTTGVALARAIRLGKPDLIPERLAPFGIFNPKGTLAVATIDEGGSDPVVPAARALAGAIATEFLHWLDHSDLPARLGIRDRGLATLILYHEHMWDLLDALVAAGVVTEPRAIRAAAPAPSDILPLMTVILRGKH